ncbi:hypothetical protein COT48_05815 [Candidatus Woesearchaeota archaeon CG08_land_8_20_14_0_20_47_9]|nr:MAG: hypothetical protein COT48_05815 [Candidatus Woesearchaeota archaeon CG08_land_8_20_14_0_20_47_9]
MLVNEFFEVMQSLEGLVPLVRTIIGITTVYLIFKLFIDLAKKSLLKKARTKKQISNVELFSRVLKYFVFAILAIFAFSSYTGSWASLGIGIGLMSAALGWALQKPITGIAAWMMIVAKRPFDIGDRVIIGSVRGDVADITLTHIYLKEIGGIVPGEENSGRLIMVPNSILFEQNIINYTSDDDYILDQVSVTITYESNINHAMEIAIAAARNQTGEIIKKVKKDPYVRTYFKDSGIEVIVRYISLVKSMQEISSKVTRDIFGRILKANDVEIAYPHTEVLLRRK